MKADPNTPPLLHPAILIPTPPAGEAMSVDGKTLVHWRWEMIKVCVPHARLLLDDMKDDELDAKCESGAGNKSSETPQVTPNQ